MRHPQQEENKHRPGVNTIMCVRALLCETNAINEIQTHLNVTRNFYIVHYLTKTTFTRLQTFIMFYCFLYF